jgi:hypothetical protein
MSNVHRCDHHVERRGRESRVQRHCRALPFAVTTFAPPGTIAPRSRFIFIAVYVDRMARVATVSRSHKHYSISNRQFGQLSAPNSAAVRNAVLSSGWVRPRRFFVLRCTEHGVQSAVSPIAIDVWK